MTNANEVVILIYFIFLSHFLFLSWELAVRKKLNTEKSNDKKIAFFCHNWAQSAGSTPFLAGDEENIIIYGNLRYFWVWKAAKCAKVTLKKIRQGFFKVISAFLTDDCRIWLISTYLIRYLIKRLVGVSLLFTQRLALALLYWERER
jgi:hypothetical protein